MASRTCSWRAAASVAQPRSSPVQGQRQCVTRARRASVREGAGWGKG